MEKRKQNIFIFARFGHGYYLCATSSVFFCFFTLISISDTRLPLPIHSKDSYRYRYQYWYMAECSNWYQERYTYIWIFILIPILIHVEYKFLPTLPIPILIQVVYQQIILILYRCWYQYISPSICRPPPAEDEEKNKWSGCCKIDSIWYPNQINKEFLTKHF